MSTTDYELVHCFQAENGFVYQGDCRDLMSIMAGSDLKYTLIFADPPFGIGVEYDGDFNDNMSDSEYLEFTRSWLHKTPDLLTEDGRLYVHVPDKCVFPVLQSAKEAGLKQDEWIIWHYRFGQCGRSRYINSKCHGLVFGKEGARMKWRPNNVLVSSDRASKYNDRRTSETKTPGKRVPFDVWGSEVSALEEAGLYGDGQYWGRVQGNSSERRSLHNNQLPEVYLKRILSGYTDVGDWVLDPFGGSGTTAVVAKGLGRAFVTIEQSEMYAQSIVDRVRNGPVR